MRYKKPYHIVLYFIVKCIEKTLFLDQWVERFELII